MACSPAPASAPCAGSRSSPRRMSLRHHTFCRATSRLPSRRGDDDATGGDADRSIATSASSSSRRFIISTTASACRCGDLNFAKRTELADLRGRVALLTGRPRQDRLPGRPQAAALAARTSSSRRASPAMRRAATRRNRTSPRWSDRLEIYGLDLAPCAEHRERSAASCWRRTIAPRRHHQQRLPDGPPSAGLLRAHDGGRGRARAGCRSRSGAR